MTNPVKQPRPQAVTGEDLARQVAELAWHKKAEEVDIVDLRGRHSLIDFFVVCTASQSRLALVIGEEAYALGKRLLGSTTTPGGWPHLERSEEWVCADLGDVVLHVFTPQAREFYGIEHLWGDAPRTRVEAATAPRVLSRER